MSDENDLILINANVNITVKSLQSIVANAKMKAGKDEKGIYRIDTADKAGEMISKFLLENGFEAYADDINNY